MKCLAGVMLFFVGVVLAKADERLPGKIIDLAGWKLTLPVNTENPGNPDEIEPRKLPTFVHSEFFFVNPESDGVVFRAPCGGATTKGSGYPRCELREMDSNGDEAAWSTADSGVRELQVLLAITQTPPVKKHVVCAQIHNREDDVLMIRLEGRKLIVERSSQPDVILDENYDLGTSFDLKVSSGGGVIQVGYNGVNKLRWEVVRRGCYFKLGCYTQSNTERGDAADSYGEVVVRRLQYVKR